MLALDKAEIIEPCGQTVVKFEKLPHNFEFVACCTTATAVFSYINNRGFDFWSFAKMNNCHNFSQFSDSYNTVLNTSKNNCICWVDPMIITPISLLFEQLQ